jgi:hypothetical protein
MKEMFIRRGRRIPRRHGGGSRNCEDELPIETEGFLRVFASWEIRNDFSSNLMHSRTDKNRLSFIGD